MMFARASLLVCCACALSAGEPQVRRVYFSALDGNGAAVTDLTAADFVVKEGGNERQVIKAEPAIARLQIAILVDDNGTGLFRVPVARFIESLLGRAEFAVSTVTGQTHKLVDYTSDTRALSEAVGKLIPGPATNDGGQLLEGISETAVDLVRRRAGRPVIVVLTVGGEEHSTVSAHQVLDQLRESGASLHVVAVVGSTLRPTVAPRTPAAMLDTNLNLSEVLGDGPKRSGGHREEIGAIAGALTGLQRLADLLKQQYVIEYARPEGVKPSDRLNISVKRRGVTLRAPTYIPDK